MKKVPISDCYCVFCGGHMPIPRIKQQREIRHLKPLYCIKCNRRTLHMEIRSLDSISKQQQKVLSYGIFPWCFEAYGYDFLKFLLYLPFVSVSDGKTFKEIVNLINPDEDMQVLYKYCSHFKTIMHEMKSIHLDLYNKLYDLVKSKTVFIEIVGLSNK